MRSQYCVSRASFRDTLSRAMKSGLVWASCASSAFAPIEVQERINCCATCLPAGPLSQICSQTLSSRQPNANERVQITDSAMPPPLEQGARRNADSTSGRKTPGYDAAVAKTATD